MTYREALEEIARQNKSDEWYPGGDYLDGYDALIDIAREAIDSDYQEPDDNTPDDQYCWHRWAESKRWSAVRWVSIKMFLHHPESFAVLISSEPPPTDWTPGGK